MHVGTPHPEHVALMAAHVSCAIVNLRQADAAREAGVIDIVRSVFDARKIGSDLQRELSRAERYKRDVSIAVVEATNLSLLEERFGKFLTDRLLQRLGESLAQNARDIDVIGAFKESGYTMILTEASSEGAENAARRLLSIARESAVGDPNVPGLELHLVAGRHHHRSRLRGRRAPHVRPGVAGGVVPTQSSERGLSARVVPNQNRTERNRPALSSGPVAFLSYVGTGLRHVFQRDDRHVVARGEELR
jgi:diguanylate cyclase (GGDEF)-like protein